MTSATATISLWHHGQRHEHGIPICPIHAIESNGSISAMHKREIAHQGLHARLERPDLGQVHPLCSRVNRTRELQVKKHNNNNNNTKNPKHDPL